MTIGLDCRICKKTIQVVLTPDQYTRYEMWRSGKITHIQDALPELPELPASTRELMISGVCGVCWDSMFGEEED